jgi:hypothetical protein
MCHLLWHFDFELARERGDVNRLWSLEGDMKHMQSWMVWERPGLWIRLKTVVR